MHDGLHGTYGGQQMKEKEDITESLSQKQGISLQATVD